jgi:DNA polymerase III gamma/tau subunit
MNLYQKYRPDCFDAMYGNEEVIASIKGVIAKKEKPHVFLFTGGSGCGKTTAARICAKELGASSLAVMEINSSNNRGIDTARQITEQMKSYPIEGDCSVFIVDELHQTTKDWQNAMLKPLEDTPNHVYFFMCTTDPQKLITAFKNRCTIFNFKPLEEKEIYRLLVKINREEEAGVDKEVIELISENCEGSPRKAIVIFEKLIGVEKEKAKKLVREEGIGEESSVEAIELCRALIGKSDWNDIASIIKTVKEEPEKIRRMILGYMNSVLLGGKMNRKAALALEFFSEPFYDSGIPGVTLACFQVWSAE